MPDMIARMAPTLPLEGFQQTIVDGMVKCLRRDRRPVLLRAPTGSGKTLMIGRVMDMLAQPGGLPILWFWFAPFSNLVSQTSDALADQCPALSARPLTGGMSFDHRAGDVLIANVQQVAKADQQRAVLAPKDETLPSIPEVVARARAAGLLIGLVVDEAHIGVDSEREFGKFCLRLSPDRMILATATPRDEKLNRFLDSAGHTSYEAFTAGRDDVVLAQLNKAYIAALIYQPTPAMKTLVDMRATVLRHAWERNLKIGRRLAELGLGTKPLLLVQVENGPAAIPDAVATLVRDCDIPPDVIRTYEGKAKDQQKLTALAHDPGVQVLVFKEAAGTGFDAPRAFVLASTKAVSDIDFATQFVGRIMRVDRELRNWSRDRDEHIEPDLDTGYVYLANPEAQAGYETAVSTIAKVKSRLEGAVEKLHQRQVGAALVISNRETAQPDFTFPVTADPADVVFPARHSGFSEPEQSTYVHRVGVAAGQTGPTDQELLPFPSAPFVHRRRFPILGFLPQRIPSMDVLERLCEERELKVYRRRPDLPAFTGAFLQEHPPGINDTVDLVRTVVLRLRVEPSLVNDAATAASGLAQGLEIETDLLSGEERQRSTWLSLHRDRIGRQALEFLKGLSPLEGGDAEEFVRLLASKYGEAVEAELRRLNKGSAPDPGEVRRVQRDAAHMIVRTCQEDIRTGIAAELAARVRVEAGAAMPDLILFPDQVPLTRSRRNIYGYLPPTQEQAEELNRYLTIDERRAIQYRRIELATGQDIAIDRFDSLWSLNAQELEMAKELDQAGFVLWWTRNPDRKPYSASVIRADHHHAFYPDFVLCVRFWEEDTPSVRLVETKRDQADAAAKMLRASKSYGQVVFLRLDRGVFRILDREGRPGPPVGERLEGLREALMQSA